MLHKRERQVKAFGIGAFVVILIPLIYITIKIEVSGGDEHFHKAYLILGVMNIVSSLLIVIVLTFSLMRIRKFSKMLKANKAIINERLMCLHLFTFWKYTINIIGVIVLSFFFYK